MQYVALFLLWPLLEIAVFIRTSAAFGAGTVFLACLISAVAGAWVIQHQGLKTLDVLRQSVAATKIPGSAVFDGFCNVIAGILLILPGFISDFVAILLLTPYFRVFLRHRFAPYVVQGGQRAQNPASDPDYIIDGEFTRVDDHAKPLFQPEKTQD